MNQTRQAADIAPKIATIVLALLIAWQLASITWKLIYPPQPDIEVRLQMGETNAVSGIKEEAATVSWASSPLFGKSAQTPTAKKTTQRISVEEKRKSEKMLAELKLVLIGVLDSSQQENSYIVVKDKGNIDIYRIGDAIRDGITITDIQPKAFVVSKGGVETRIFLTDKESSQAYRTASASRSYREDSTTSESSDFRVTNKAVRERIEQYRETMKDNPLELMNKVRTSLVNRNGEPYGLRLRPGSDRMLLTNVGLRSGDILISINDVSVTDTANLESVVSSLAEGNNVSLKIERAGKLRDLNVILD